MTAINQIKSEEEYNRILKRIEVIFDAKPGTQEGDELESLVKLVEKYEDKNYFINSPGIKASIKFRMEQLGFDTTDLVSSKEMIIHPGETLKEAMEDRNISAEELAQCTGFSSTYIKDVLNCKETISADFARKLEDTLNIDADFWMKLNEDYNDELKAFEESHLA